MDFINGIEFPDTFNKMSAFQPKNKGYVTNGIDHSEIMSALGWRGVTMFRYYAFLKTKKTINEEEVMLQSIGLSRGLGGTPPPLTDSLEAEGLKLTIALNTKYDNLSFYDPGRTFVGFNTRSIEPEYTIYFEFNNVRKNAHELDRVAVFIGTHEFASFMKVINACGQDYNNENKKVIYDMCTREWNLAGDDPDKLDGIYEIAPQFAINMREEKLLWKDLASLMAVNVDSWGTNEENAVMKILAALSSAEKFSDHGLPEFRGQTIMLNPKADEFLYYLLAIKVDDQTDRGKEKSLFELLYEKMHNFGGEDNFTKLMQQLYLVWFQSSLFVYSTSHNMDYQSEKTLGFYQTSHDFELLEDGTTIEMSDWKGNFFTEYILGIVPIGNSTRTMHIYDRVSLVNTSKIKISGDGGELMQIPEIVPAFFLKGLDDQAAAANLETGIMLAVDILTAFTGFGNLMKFSRLISLIKAVEGVSRVAKGFALVKIGLTGVEIFSGTLSIMITLAEEDETEFGNKLRNFLFWVDLATLSADAITSKFLKNSAKEALDNAGNLGKNSEQYQEVINALQGIAGPGDGFKILTQDQLARLTKIKNTVQSTIQKTVIAIKNAGAQLLISDIKKTGGELVYRVKYNSVVLLEGTQTTIQHYLVILTDVLTAGRNKSFNKIFEASYIKKVEGGRGYGAYGGKILTTIELNKWSKVLLQKYGSTLKKVDKFEFDDVLAQFDSNTNTVLYKEGTTNYLIFHESMHAQECLELGKDGYQKNALPSGQNIEDLPDNQKLLVLTRSFEHADEQGFNLEEQYHNHWHLRMYEYDMKEAAKKIK